MGVEAEVRRKGRAHVAAVLNGLIMDVVWRTIESRFGCAMRSGSVKVLESEWINCSAAVCAGAVRIEKSGRRHQRPLPVLVEEVAAAVDSHPWSEGEGARHRDGWLKRSTGEM